MTERWQNFFAATALILGFTILVQVTRLVNLVESLDRTNKHFNDHVVCLVKDSDED